MIKQSNNSSSQKLKVDSQNHNHNDSPQKTVPFQQKTIMNMNIKSMNNNNDEINHLKKVSQNYLPIVSDKESTSYVRWKGNHYLCCKESFIYRRIFTMEF